MQHLSMMNSIGTQGIHLELILWMQFGAIHPNGLDSIGVAEVGLMVSATRRSLGWML